MSVSAQGREGEVERWRDEEMERGREGKREDNEEDTEDRDARKHIESYTH